MIQGGSYTSPNNYSDQLFDYVGSPLIGTTYNSALFATTVAGTITNVFTDFNNATMTFTVDGVAQTKNIKRLSF